MNQNCQPREVSKRAWRKIRYFFSLASFYGKTVVSLSLFNHEASEAFRKHFRNKTKTRFFGITVQGTNRLLIFSYKHNSTFILNSCIKYYLKTQIGKWKETHWNKFQLQKPRYFGHVQLANRPNPFAFSPYLIPCKKNLIRENKYIYNIEALYYCTLIGYVSSQFEPNSF